MLGEGSLNSFDRKSVRFAHVSVYQRAVLELWSGVGFEDQKLAVAHSKSSADEGYRSLSLSHLVGGLFLKGERARIL